MAADLATLFRKVNDHSNQEERQRAESFLRELEQQDRFGIELLNLIRQTPQTDITQLLATIYFKNFVKRNWVISDDGHKYVKDQDRHEIKQMVVQLMLGAPPPIKRQLSAAITLIAAEDFPAQWQDLLPTLTQRLQGADDTLTFGALEIIESITKRYINANINQETHDHIRYFMSVFAVPWLQLLTMMTESIERELSTTPQSSNASLKLRVESVTLLVKIFWDLHTVDIIDWFEERMNDWVPLFLRLLRLEDQSNVLQALPDAAGPLEKSRAQVMRCLVLYNGRYEEQYRRFVADFVTTTCELVSRLNSSERYDELVSQAMAYISSVIGQEWHKQLFDQNKIELIVRHIVTPNIRLRDSDLTMYEIEGESYVSRDLEGSDMETRRRGVSDLITSICKHFQEVVTGIVLNQINLLMEEYKKDPQNNFIAKDAAITLVLAVGVKGKTRNAGATLLNDRIDIPGFFQAHILPPLRRDEKCHPLIYSDAIKFLVMFRSIWDEQTFKSMLGLLVSFLGEEDYVLHTYAAFAIEKILALKTGELNDRRFRFSTEDLNSNLPETLGPLLTILTQRQESYENKHVMNAILKVVVRSEAGLSRVIGMLLEQVSVVLKRIAAKPAKPDFNHLVFEVIAASISSICKRHPQQAQDFERHLVPMMFSILENDKISEFHPYVYQLLALLLRLRPDISKEYQQLFDKLLFPPLWNQEGAIQAISGMFGDYLSRANVNEFVNQKRLEGMLGIFQKLLSTRGHDYHAFEILRSVFEYVPMSMLNDRYLHMALQLCFQRLQGGKRKELCCNFIVCLGSFIAKHGIREMIRAMDLVQPGIFGMVVASVWIPYSRKISNLTHRRITTFAMVNMLNSDVFWSGPLKEHIPKLFEKTIELFEVDPEEDRKQNHNLEYLEAQGFDTKFSKLNYAFAPVRDVTREMGDPRAAFVRALVPRLEADSVLRGQLRSSLEDLYVQQFSGYCQRAEINFRL